MIPKTNLSKKEREVEQSLQNKSKIINANHKMKKTPAKKNLAKTSIESDLERNYDMLPNS